MLSAALETVENTIGLAGDIVHMANSWLNWTNTNYHNNLNFGPFHHGKQYLKKMISDPTPWPHKEHFKEFLDYIHSHKQEWDFLTDNGNLFRRYLPEYGSSDSRKHSNM